MEPLQEEPEEDPLSSAPSSARSPRKNLFAAKFGQRNNAAFRKSKWKIAAAANSPTSPTNTTEGSPAEPDLPRFGRRSAKSPYVRKKRSPASSFTASSVSSPPPSAPPDDGVMVPVHQSDQVDSSMVDLDVSETSTGAYSAGDTYRKHLDDSGLMYGSCGLCNCVAYLGISSDTCEDCGHGRDAHKSLAYNVNSSAPVSPMGSPDSSFLNASGSFIRGIMNDKQVEELQNHRAEWVASRQKKERLVGIWTDELRGDMAQLEAPIADPKGEGESYPQGSLLIDNSPDPYGMEPQEAVLNAIEKRIARHGRKPSILCCGSRHTAALTSAGDLYAWGDNNAGQLGIGLPGDNTDRFEECVPQFSAVAVRSKGLGGHRCLSVSCGAEFTFVITDTNSVFSWGDNYFGQLGHGDTKPRGHPAQIMNLTPKQGFNDTLVQVSCGNSHAILLVEAGSMLVMGCGSFGALGKGDAAHCDYPKRVEINTSDLSNPSTPVNTPRTPTTPHGTALKGRAATMVPVVEVATGSNHTIALSREGRMYSWGLSLNGRLGIGENTEQMKALGIGFADHILRPREIKPLKDQATGVEYTIHSIAAGHSHSAAVTTDGLLFTWGSGEHYKLSQFEAGIPQLKDAWVPKRTGGVIATRFVTGVACGDFHTLASTKMVGRTKAALFAWGGGFRGKLGIGLQDSTLEDLNVPQATPVNMFTGRPPIAMSASAVHSAVVTDDGNLYAWGFGGPKGIHGHGSAHTIATPKQVASLDGITLGIATNVTPAYRLVERNKDVGDIRGKQARSNVSETNRVMAVECGGSFSLAVTTKGDLYAWGDNCVGQLGMAKGVGDQHSNAWRPNLIRVGVTTPGDNVRILERFHRSEVLQVSAGYRHAMAIAKNSHDDNITLFAWGSTDRGVLGISKDELTIVDEQLDYDDEADADGLHDFIEEPFPVRLDPKHVPAMVSCGAEHTALITQAGRLLTWGSGHYGRLGHGDTVDQWEPKLIRWAESGNRTQKLVSCGATHTLSVGQGDKVFSWGSGWRYKLGHGGQENETKPREIEELRHDTKLQIIASEFHSACLTDEGEIYTWGYGANGRLGHGLNDDNSFRSEYIPRLLELPQEIKMLPIIHHTDLLTQKHKDRVVKIASGKDFMLALTWSGTLFGWGKNDKGQLGLNNAVAIANAADDPVPEQLTLPKIIRCLPPRSYVDLSCGPLHTLALEATLKVDRNGPRVRYHEQPSNSGHVYSWGHGGTGRLGHGKTSFGQGIVQDRAKEVEVLAPHSESPCAQLAGMLRGRLPLAAARVQKHYKKLDEEMLLLGTNITLNMFQIMLKSEPDGFEAQVLNMVESVNELEYEVKNVATRNLALECRVRGLEHRIRLLVNNKKQQQVQSMGKELYTPAQIVFRRNLPQYEVLLYLLQREPKYLSRLALTAVDAAERATVVKLCQQLFGPNSHDHVLLLRFMQHAIKDEFVLTTEDPTNLPLRRGSSVTADLIQMYLKRKECLVCQKKMLRPIVDLVLESDRTARGLVDLDLDPLNIFRTRLMDEKAKARHAKNASEVATRKKMIEMKRKKVAEAYMRGDVLEDSEESDAEKDDDDQEEEEDDDDDILSSCTGQELYAHALKDETTRKELRARAETLTSGVQKCLEQFAKNVDAIPYGVRFLCKELWQGGLMIGDPEGARHYAASLLIHDFLLRGLALPDALGVTPDELLISRAVRLNLTVMSKVLHCLAVDKKFSTSFHEDYVEPVNDFIRKSKPLFVSFMEKVVHIESLESFAREPLLAQYITANPFQIRTRYNTLFALHRMVAHNIGILAESMDEPLQMVADEMDTAAPGAVSACDDDFCTVLLVDKYGTPPEPPPQPTPHQKWIRDTKQILMRAFQQMSRIDKLKEKFMLNDTSNNVDVILKCAKEEASRGQHYMVASDIGELQVRLAAMAQTKVASLEQIQLDVLTDIRNFSFNQVRLDREAALLQCGYEVVLDRRRFLMLQEKALKSTLVQARETLFKPAAVAIATGMCEKVTQVLFLRERATSEFTFAFDDLVGQGIVTYTHATLPEDFLRCCTAHFSSEVPGVIGFRMLSPKGAKLYTDTWFFDDLLLNAESSVEWLNLNDEVQLNLSALIALLNTLFCVDN